MFLFIEKLLGRASSIGAFIKRGEESGYIKISLRGETKEEQLTIRRKIDTRNKSEWIFNGHILMMSKNLAFGIFQYVEELRKLFVDFCIYYFIIVGIQ